MAEGGWYAKAVGHQVSNEPDGSEYAADINAKKTLEAGGGPPV